MREYKQYRNGSTIRLTPTRKSYNKNYKNSIEGITTKMKYYNEQYSELIKGIYLFDSTDQNLKSVNINKAKMHFAENAKVIDKRYMKNPILKEKQN